MLAVILAVCCICGCSESSGSDNLTIPINEAETVSTTPVVDLSLNNSFFDNTTHHVPVNDTWQRNEATDHMDFWIPTDEERATYLYPDISNDICGNQMALRGNVTLDRYQDQPLPEYNLTLTVSPNASAPVKFDFIEVYFGSDISDRKVFFANASSIVTDTQTGKKVMVPSITINPGEEVPFGISSVNWLNTLLANSTTGNTYLTVSFYDGDQIVGVFHSCPPAVYEFINLDTGLDTPIGIQVGETKPLLFEDYETVGKKVDANFFANNPYYAQGEGASASVSEEATATEPNDTTAEYHIMTDPGIVNQLTIAGTAHYDNTSGIYTLDLDLSNDGDIPVVFNQTQVIIENGHGNGTCLTLAHTGVDASGNTYPLTILPGQSEPLTLTSTAIGSLASASSKGKVALHIESYNGAAGDPNKLIGDFHAVLPPMSDLQNGATKQVIFASYAEVHGETA